MLHSSQLLQVCTNSIELCWMKNKFVRKNAINSEEKEKKGWERVWWGGGAEEKENKLCIATLARWRQDIVISTFDHEDPLLVLGQIITPNRGFFAKPGNDVLS